MAKARARKSPVTLRDLQRVARGTPEEADEILAAVKAQKQRERRRARKTA